MVSGTVSVPSACCSRQWGRGSRLDFFDRLLCSDKSNLAMSPVAERLCHRATAAAERDPGFALRSGFPFSLWNRNGVSLVVNEIYLAVDSVGTILANLDGDFCHLSDLEKKVRYSGADGREIDLTNRADVIGQVRNAGYDAVQLGLSYLARLLQKIEPVMRFVSKLVTQLLPLHG